MYWSYILTLFYTISQTNSDMEAKIDSDTESDGSISDPESIPKSEARKCLLQKMRQAVRDKVMSRITIYHHIANLLCPLTRHFYFFANDTNGDIDATIAMQKRVLAKKELIKLWYKARKIELKYQAMQKKTKKNGRMTKRRRKSMRNSLINSIYASLDCNENENDNSNENDENSINEEETPSEIKWWFAEKEFTDAEKKKYMNNPLLWWNSKEARLKAPILRRVALIIFVMMATSCPAESMFSIFAWIANCKRSNMTHIHGTMIHFLKGAL